MKSKYVLLALCTTLLVGCQKYQKKHHAEAAPEPEVIVVSDYDAGFSHGCNSGVHYDNSVIAEKDFQRRAQSSAYSMGWDDGFTECRFNPYKGHKPEYHTVY